MNTTNQVLNGNVIVDSISTVTMNFNAGTNLTGAINNDNQGKTVTVTLSKDAVWTLTGDSYVTNLTNEDASGSNIHTNGYTLHIKE